MAGKIAAALAFLFVLCLPPAHAKNLLIQGGTLIAGTDQAPLRDTRILVEGNVIRRVWTGAAAPQSLPRASASSTSRAIGACRNS